MERAAFGASGEGTIDMQAVGLILGASAVGSLLIVGGLNVLAKIERALEAPLHLPKAAPAAPAAPELGFSDPG